MSFINTALRFSTGLRPTFQQAMGKIPSLLEKGASIQYAREQTNVKHFPEFTFGNRSRETLTAGFSAIRKSPYTDYHKIAPKAGGAFQLITPLDLQQKLVDMVAYETPPVLLLKNCPVGPDIATPEEDQHNPRKGFVEELFMLGLMQNLYCNPFHDRNEKRGELFAQVIPMKGYELEKSSRGSAGAFGWHTEHIHLSSEEGIHFLCLFCVKGDSAAKTGFLFVDDIVKTLPSWVIEGLQKPIFEMATGPSWPSTKVQRISSVLQPDFQGGFYIQYNHDHEKRLIAKTEEGRQSLDYFAHHIENMEPRAVSLERGDCVVFNNQKVLHCRDSYTPTTSWEERRWLLRLYMQINWKALVQQLFRKNAISYKPPLVWAQQKA